MNCCYHSVVNNIYSVTESKLGLRYSYTTATEEDIYIKLTQLRCITDGFTSLTSQTSDEELFLSIRTKAWTIFLLLTPKSLKTAVQLQNSAQHNRAHFLCSLKYDWRYPSQWRSGPRTPSYTCCCRRTPARLHHFYFQSCLTADGTSGTWGRADECQLSAKITNEKCEMKNTITLDICCKVLCLLHIYEGETHNGFWNCELSVLNRSYNILLFAFKLHMFCLTRETQSLVMTCY